MTCTRPRALASGIFSVAGVLFTAPAHAIMSMKRLCAVAVVGLSLLAVSGTTRAEFIGNVQGGADFPAGAASFADVLVNFSPILDGTTPSAAHRQGDRVLGVPDYDGTNTFDDNPTAATFASLGNGGSITVRFTNNVLTGSGNTDPDLFIFEVGPAVEATFVEVSNDGVNWNAVGQVVGSLSTVDLDAFGFGVLSEFSYVRLTDDALADIAFAPTAGADIDAIGAISARLVPEPSTFSLAALGIAGLLARHVRRRHANR